MKLDVPFAEALERYAGVDPKEMRANIQRAKKAKPPGGEKSPPSGPDDQAENVVKLAVRRTKKRDSGR